MKHQTCIALTNGNVIDNDASALLEGHIPFCWVVNFNRDALHDVPRD